MEWFFPAVRDSEADAALDQEWDPQRLPSHLEQWRCEEEDQERGRQRLPNRSSERMRGRRLNSTAAMPWRYEEDRGESISKDMSFGTMEESQSSRDSSTDYDSEVITWRGLRNPRIPTSVLVILTIIAIFVSGLSFGMATRPRKVARFQSQDNKAPTPAPNSHDNIWQHQSNYLVGVYYYPWHGSNFHNGGGYVRKQLDLPQFPTLGEYDDSRPETIAQHLAWSRQANIGLWVTSWWGPNRLEDMNTKDVIMEHKDLGDMKIALHYESTGRIRDSDMSTVKSDFEHICEHYFNHPNYYRVDGRPVVMIYVTRKLQRLGLLEAAVLTMRRTASKCGHGVYLVGDHVFEGAPGSNETFAPFWYFDAVTNYDSYGSMGRPSPYAGAEAVNRYYREQAEWRSRAIENGCRYIPTVSPGYNDRGVRLAADHPPLSRKLTADSEEGTLFSHQLDMAKPLVDPMVDSLLMINSFNEWHEDTQIEPLIGISTSRPFNLTHGIEYEAYGELYLNILRDKTVD